MLNLVGESFYQKTDWFEIWKETKLGIIPDQQFFSLIKIYKILSLGITSETYVLENKPV